MCFPNNSTTASVLPENEAAAAIWNAGGREYDRISRQIADAIEHCVDRLAPQPMERILDLATGTGWAARRIADRGASVTGIDLSSEAIETARSLDLSGKTDFHVGDAEALSFPDQDFDAIISTFGVMFCGNPSQAASEMARVCKPGGRMALAIWDNHGGVFDMFELISSHKPKSSPAASSPSRRVRKRLP